MFLLRQYMLTIPDELIDAARMDHASEWRLFWRIVLPLAAPALAVLAIFSVVWRWNDFLWPPIVLNREEVHPATRPRIIPGRTANPVALSAGDDCRNLVANNVGIRVPAEIHHDRNCIGRDEIVTNCANPATLSIRRQCNPAATSTTPVMMI